MESDFENKPSKQQKLMAFMKRKKRAIILTALTCFALGTAGSFFIELSYAGTCKSTVCTNGFKWITISGTRICVSC
ncbi:hypothetical protein JCM14076_27260 [Methylosoma difficile]